MSTTKNCWTCGWNFSSTSIGGEKYSVCVYPAVGSFTAKNTKVNKWRKLTPFVGEMPKNKHTLRRCPGWGAK